MRYCTLLDFCWGIYQKKMIDSFLVFWFSKHWSLIWLLVASGNLEWICSHLTSRPIIYAFTIVELLFIYWERQPCSTVYPGLKITVYLRVTVDLLHLPQLSVCWVLGFRCGLLFWLWCWGCCGKISTCYSMLFGYKTSLNVHLLKYLCFSISKYGKVLYFFNLSCD